MDVPNQAIARVESLNAQAVYSMQAGCFQTSLSSLRQGLALLRTAISGLDSWKEPSHQSLWTPIGVDEDRLCIPVGAGADELPIELVNQDV